MTQIRPLFVRFGATLSAGVLSAGVLSAGLLSACSGGGNASATGMTTASLASDGKTAADGAFGIGVGATAGKPGFEGVTRGVQLAVDRLNTDAGGTTRFVVRIPSAATGAVQIAQQLRDDPGVIAVVGHPESGSSLEAIPVYEDAEHSGARAVVAISPTASSPSLSGISPWFFRVAPSDNEAARLVARYVADSLGAKTVAIIYRNDSYGRDWSTRFSETYAGKTRTVLARIPYLTGITEWKAYALQLKKLAPEVLLFPGDADDATAMLRELKANDVPLTFVGGDGTAGIARTHEFPGARYAAFFLPERAATAEGKRFVDSYRARFNEEPDMFAALSFDAALVIGRTVIAGARTRNALRDQLELITDATAIDGAGGRIAFNKQHDITGRTVVIATVGVPPTNLATKATPTAREGAK